MSGTCTITVDLAFASHPGDRVNSLWGVGFDEDPATMTIATQLAERLIDQCVTPAQKGYVTNGIGNLVQALENPARTTLPP